MDKQSHRIPGAFDRLWKAIVKAFTPTRPPGGESQAFGAADTTLFGPAAEPGASSRKSSRGADDTWGAGGDSSYFADHAPGKDRERR